MPQQCVWHPLVDVDEIFEVQGEQSKGNLEIRPPARSKGNTHPQTTYLWGMLGLFPMNKMAKKGGLGGLLPSLPDLLRDKAPRVWPACWLCAFLVTRTAGCMHSPGFCHRLVAAPSAVGEAGVFLSLEVFLWKPPLPFEGGSMPLFYALVALETSCSIQCPEPDVRTPKTFGSEVGKRALGKGGREENLN